MNLKMSPKIPLCGGRRAQALQALLAAVMRAVEKDLMKMIVVELKQELEARAEPKTGSKAWLLRGYRARAPRRLRAVRRASPGGGQTFTVLDDPRVLLPF